MDKVVEIEAIRKEKEQQFKQLTSLHLESFQTFVERVNIREKVKAKHVFKEMVEHKRSTIFTEKEEQLFSEWFKFDYMTINGRTLYQEFLAQSTVDKQHPSNAVLHALLLASVLEPFKVIKSENGHIHAMKLLTGEHCKFHSVPSKLNKNAIVFIRSIPLYNDLLCVSEKFVIEEELAISFQTVYQKQDESWRAFLKRNAIKYIWSKFRIDQPE